MEHKSFATEFKVTKGNRLEGYASVFGNEDSHRDIVKSGAFTKTIKERKERIKVLYQHSTFYPIGRPEIMQEDKTGLWTESLISDTPLGRDVLTLAADGVLSEMSIGYDTVKAMQRNEEGIRELIELRLWEYSPVTFASNELALIAGVKEDAQFDVILERLNFFGDHGLKSGRVLSKQNFQRLEMIVSELQGLLKEATPEPSKDTQGVQEPNPDKGVHSEVFDALSDIRNQTAQMKLAAELRNFSRTLRGE